MNFKNMQNICTICARGGSKGVPNKNLKLIKGIPLIAHSILQAKKANCFKFIAVSSDSEEILNVSQRHGANILIKRPEHLASDKAAKLPAIQHCLEQVEQQTGQAYDIIVDLDATSPLRAISDINAAISLLIETKCDNVITGTKSRRSPYFNLVEKNNDGTIYLSKNMDTLTVRRQDSPDCYDMNASIYVWWRNLFLQNPKVFNKNTRILEMPEERSLDVDTLLDFEIIKFLMEKE